MDKLAVHIMTLKAQLGLCAIDAKYLAVKICKECQENVIRKYYKPWLMPAQYFDGAPILELYGFRVLTVDAEECIGCNEDTKRNS